MPAFDRGDRGPGPRLRITRRRDLPPTGPAGAHAGSRASSRAWASRRRGRASNGSYGVVRPLWIGAVIDAFSRRVLASGAVRGAPSGSFAGRLLRDAISRNDTPRWLVTDKDPELRGGLVQRPIRALEARLRRWQRWHNSLRPHQGLEQRTPDDVYRGRRPRRVRHLTAVTLSVRFLDGDPRLPTLRLRDAA